MLSIYMPGGNCVSELLATCGQDISDLGRTSYLRVAAGCPASVRGVAARAGVGRAPTLAPLHGLTRFAIHASRQAFIPACL